MDELLRDEKEKLDFVRVSQHTREVSRIPIPRQVEKLREELESLNAEKREIEQKLNDAAEWKREELAVVYSMRYPKSRACEKTNAIEAELLRRRKPLLRDLHSIEERRNQIASRLKESKGRRTSNEKAEQLSEMHQIRVLLERIVKKMGA